MAADDREQNGSCAADALNRRQFLQSGVAVGAALWAGGGPALAAGNTNAEYDFVLVGAGHNNLICANYLAKAGYSCLVLEAKTVVGGNTATEPLTLPGFLHDPCANTPGQIASGGIPEELDLAEHGLAFAKQAELSSTYQLGSGADVNVWTGNLDRTIEEFARFSKRDADKIRKVLTEMRPYVEARHQFRSTPIGFGPSFPEIIMSKPSGGLWLRRHMQPMAHVIEETVRNEDLRTFLLYMGMLFRSSPYDAGSGMHPFLLLSLATFAGWTKAVGGTATLPKALVSALQAKGGKVLTSKFVVGFVLDKGKCIGIETADGSVYRCKHAVVSSQHPKQLVDLVPEQLGAYYVESIRQYRTKSTHSVFSIHLALSEPPLWNVNGRRLPATEAGVIESFAAQVRSYELANAGTLNYEVTPTMHVITPTVIDSSRAPAGKHVVKIESFQPYELSDGGAARWDEVKFDYAQFHLRALKKFTPNLNDDKILGMHVHSPLDVEGRNINNVGGDCWGGTESLGQMDELRPVPGWATHRTPIDGLYLTGASTHPGGAVHGLAGRNAAQVVLKDMGRSFESVVGGVKKDTKVY